MQLQRKQPLATNRKRPFMEAAGIATADAVPQVVSPHATCVEHACQWLRYGCADAARQELVADWHRLTPKVRSAIMELVRSSRPVP
jgi:hypothetical protein